jgi:hypothetical protein
MPAQIANRRSAKWNAQVGMGAVIKYGTGNFAGVNGNWTTRDWVLDLCPCGAGTNNYERTGHGAAPEPAMH